MPPEEMETQVQEAETSTEVELEQEVTAEGTLQEEPTSPIPEPTSPKEGKVYPQAEVSKIQRQMQEQINALKAKAEQAEAKAEQSELASAAAAYIREAEERGLAAGIEGEGEKARLEVQQGVATYKQRRVEADLAQQRYNLEKAQAVIAVSAKFGFTDPKEIEALNSATTPEHLGTIIENLQLKKTKAKAAIKARPAQKFDGGVTGGSGSRSFTPAQIGKLSYAEWVKAGRPDANK